mmetsp:Transcript_113066/g.269555  ORF Transcript_113066/g.269555 Transcript_113066/m.269555 type:complete len:201 (-) Transcript_113066:7-609(-)
MAGVVDAQVHWDQQPGQQHRQGGQVGGDGGVPLQDRGAVFGLQGLSHGAGGAVHLVGDQSLQLLRKGLGLGLQNLHHLPVGCELGAKPLLGLLDHLFCGRGRRVLLGSCLHIFGRCLFLHVEVARASNGKASNDGHTSIERVVHRFLRHQGHRAGTSHVAQFNGALFLVHGRGVGSDQDSEASHSVHGDFSSATFKHGVS